MDRLVAMETFVRIGVREASDPRFFQLPNSRVTRANRSSNKPRMHGARWAVLYAFARMRRKPAACFAHATNQMAVVEADFKKGDADGSAAALKVIAGAARAWRRLAAAEPTD